MKNTVKLIGLIAFVFSFANLYGQNTQPDTVEVEFGEKSRAVFHIANDEDMETLKDLDFNEIIENIDESIRDARGEKTEEEKGEKEKKDDRNIQITIGRDKSSKKAKKNTISHNIDISLGINTFLQDGKTVSGTNYELRPMGSRYIALGSMFKTKLSHGKVPLYFQYGVEFSWYNFMFEGNNFITKGQDENLFRQHDLELKKSKLVVSYINLPVMFGIGSKYKNTFTLGVGGYVGYRLGSHSKIVSRVDDNLKTDKDKSNFHLNDVRYGLKAEVGFGRKHGGITLFANYDMNELFQSGKAPAIQAFSFGIKL